MEVITTIYKLITNGLMMWWNIKW